MDDALWRTPEGVMNLLLATVVAASLLVGLLFAAVEFGLLPTVA